MGFEKELKDKLRGKRFGVVGIGNVIKGDDGAGCVLVEKLGEDFPMPTVDCAEVPENYGGWVERRDLEAAVYVDAIDFGGEPGEVRIVPLEKMMETATSTHHLSLHYMIRFLKEEWDGEAVMVGIQPGSMELGDGVSEAVEAGVDRLAEVLREALE
jgi:hydrogenase 3 maturation protease